VARSGDAGERRAARRPEHHSVRAADPEPRLRQDAAVIILSVLGGIPFVWGIIGWLRKRLGGNK
jgi:hypothetical protein